MNATATIGAQPRESQSEPQHMRALERANRVRLARAELKRRVGKKRQPVAEVILSSPWEAESMTIADLLTSQPRWGATRCRRFLATIPMSETKTIGSMTQRQRHALAEQLGHAIAGTGSEPCRIEAVGAARTNGTLAAAETRSLARV